MTSSSRYASTGSDFPLSASGSTASTRTASRTSERVPAPIRISPGGAACSSRAATLTASPVTSVSPSPPTTTSPVLMPSRASSPCSAIACAHLRRRSDGAERVVLVRDRNPEHRHDRVACELLDAAAVALEDRPQVLEVAAHARAQRFGIGRLAERGRADDVAEEDADDLALLARRLSGDAERRRAGHAEARFGGVLDAAARAGRHPRSLGGLQPGENDARAAGRDDVALLLVERDRPLDGRRRLRRSCPRARAPRPRMSWSSAFSGRKSVGSASATASRASRSASAMLPRLARTSAIVPASAAANRDRRRTRSAALAQRTTPPRPADPGGM